jgi:hypothetical protein
MIELTAVEKLGNPRDRNLRLLDKPSACEALVELLVELVEAGYEPPLLDTDQLNE